MTDKPHPVQPVVVVEGVMRFKANPIVRDLLDFASERGFGLNEIACRSLGRGYQREDHEQFAQLIGYSLSGAAELDYMSDATLDVAERTLQAVEDPKLSDALRQFGSIPDVVSDEPAVLKAARAIILGAWR